MATVRTRFAPSPTGFMHVGNLRTALYEYLVAKSQGGKFVLRIEDTDRERLVEGAEAVIYKTLDQVGLRHDEGPDVGGEYGPYVQSLRKDLYKPYAHQLVREGKAYYCFCTKERLESLHNEEGIGGYDRHCRDLPAEEVQRLLEAGTPYVIRQKVPLTGSTTFEDAVFGSITIENKEIEDQVLLKADGYPTKLSKRHGSTSFEGLVAEGYLPQVITNYIALLGWAPKDNQEIFSLPELVQAFSIDGISKSPAVFDYDKLNWFNAEYIKAMGEEEFTAHAMPYYREVFGAQDKPWEVLYSILPARITKFQEIPGLLHFLKELPDYPADFFVNKKSKANLENAPQMLQAAIPVLEALPDWNVTAIHDSLIALAGELGVKNGTLLWPVRIAAAGTQVTPGGAMEILALLGREEALRRLQAGLAKLQA